MNELTATTGLSMSAIGRRPPGTDAILSKTAAQQAAERAWTYSYGTTGQGIDQWYEVILNIPASGNVDIDLGAGAQTNPLFETSRFQTVRSVVVIMLPNASSVYASEVTVGGHPSEALPKVAGKVMSEGAFAQESPNGLPAVNGADILRLTNVDAVNIARVQVRILGVKP